MKPEAVDSAQAALARLTEAAQRGEPYRLVVSDAFMPNIDGLGFGRAIKADPRLEGTRLILLTSGPLGRFDPRGGVFSAVLSKPVKQSDLLDAIVGAFGPRAKQRLSATNAQNRFAGRQTAKAAAADSGRGRQRHESEAGCRALRTASRRRGDCAERVRGGRAIGRRAVRLDSDGRADARHERPRGHGGHSRA